MKAAERDEVEKSRRHRPSHFSTMVSYEEHSWWFEAADLWRKLMLTGVVLNVAQGTTIQIWFGLLSSSAASLIMVRFEPYREPLCNLLQKAATIQILFTC